MEAIGDYVGHPVGAHGGSSGWSNSLGQMMAAWCARLCLISFRFPDAMCKKLQMLRSLNE